MPAFPPAPPRLPPAGRPCGPARRPDDAPAGRADRRAGRGARRGEPGRGGPVRRRRRHPGAAGRRRQQPGRGRRGVRRTSGPHPQRRDHRGVRPVRRGVRRGRGGRELGRRRGHRRTQGVGRHRGALRHPGDDRGDADPERGCLRAGGLPDRRPGAHLDRKLRGIRTFAADECSFGYRTSRFKRDPGRFVVLSTTFQFPLGISARRCSTPSWPAPSASPSVNVHLRERCAKRFSTCVGARRWCSTRGTTTPGARARSSPTRSSRRTPYRMVHRPGRSRRAWSRRALPG